MLQSLLAQFGGRRSFIVWKLVPATPKDIKQPVNPYTGLPTDAQDPATWMSADEAVAWVTAGVATGVGFVIHEGCGIACIDLDKQYDPQTQQWTPFAQDVLRRFPLAAKEYGFSGDGCHIWVAVRSDIPEHRTRQKSRPGLECYSRARFVATTGVGLVGDLRAQDYSVEFQQLIADYLPEALGARDAEWTDGPYEGWRGSGTDEQIVHALRNRRGAAAVFGGGASFDDLWTANEDALAHAFPDGTGKNSYDRSAADQAMANHVAWGTGFDCERTLRIMRMSELQRDKWERDDYLQRTILRAVAGKRTEAETKARQLQTNAAPLQQAPPAPPPEPPAHVPPPPPVAAAAPEAPPAPTTSAAPSAPYTGPEAGKYYTIAEMQARFADHVYVQDIHRIILPNGEQLDQKQFNARHGGEEFQMTTDGGSSTNDAWEGYLENRVHPFPRADAMLFDPTKPPHTVVWHEGRTHFNSYAPVDVPMIAGDVTLFLDHVRKLFPYGQDAAIFLAYLAFMCRHKGKKSAWWPLLQGVEGNGKSFFSQVMEQCIGQRYTHHAKADQIASQFNSAFYGKLLICIEDVYISESRSSVWETLKPMITQTRMEIEGKGVNKVTREVCFNGLMNSNHKNAIRKTPNDRRLAPFFGAQQSVLDLRRDGLNPEYFKRLYGWFERDGGSAIIAHYLHNYEIPDALNPAVDCVVAPRTTSTEAAIVASRGSIEQEVIEAIDSGRDGFRDGWLSSVAFDGVLSEMGRSKALPRTQRIDLIVALGYEPHPGLPQGRTISTLPDGTRPVLYVKSEHPSYKLQGAAVVDAYVKAQAPKK